MSQQQILRDVYNCQELIIYCETWLTKHALPSEACAMKLLHCLIVSFPRGEPQIFLDAKFSCSQFKSALR